MPFYVAPEQQMKDRADYARKGIGRGRSVIVMHYAEGILFVAENRSQALHKVSEIYDRIGFAAVGRYNEFENLRTAGIRYADLRGYSYDRTDVTGRGLANAYAQLLGTIFSSGGEKPYEVEIIVAELGASQELDQIYRLTYDGSVGDEQDFAVMGGSAERPTAYLKDTYRTGASLEDSIRRLIRSLHGAPRARRKLAARGTVDAARTMRANLRYDGVPFRPITVAKVTDRPSLLLLADVSLSVRTAARFTLQLVHGLQSMVSHVRSFAFVSDLVEITDLFAEHPPEDALSLVVSGLSAGGVLDVDADSDYGTAMRTFLEEFGGAINRRTTVIVLGDGRTNGRDPNLEAFEEISRRARETIWITPEPSYSWGLGSCDLPGYAALCDRVHVVHDLSALEQVSVDAYGA